MNRGIKIIFWSVEIAFALISGVSEAIIYQAYSVDDWAGTAQAFMRAGGMQLMIVMFGFAAVQASKNGKPGLVWLANALALGFSFISFWFIRESAIAEAHLALLQSAYNQPLSFAGITIGGQGLDPNLIGCIPFLQTALNWFAPVITQDTKVTYVETIEEMEERQQRELLKMQFAQQKRALSAKGAVSLVGTISRATVATVTGKDAAITEEPEVTEALPPASEAVPVAELVPLDAAQEEAATPPTAPQRVVEEELPPPPATRQNDKAFRKEVQRQIGLIRGAGMTPTVEEVARRMKETTINVTPIFDDIMLAPARR